MKTLIIIITLAVLAIVIGAIVIGTRSFEGIVVEKPYETGLAWDSVNKEKASLGWRVDVTSTRFGAGTNNLLLRISDREGKPLSDAEVSIMVSRPSTNAYDSQYRAVDRSGGIYETHILLPLFGYWNVDVHVAYSGKNVLFHEKIYAEKPQG